MYRSDLDAHCVMTSPLSFHITFSGTTQALRSTVARKSNTRPGKKALHVIVLVKRRRRSNPETQGPHWQFDGPRWGRRHGHEYSPLLSTIEPSFVSLLPHENSLGLQSEEHVVSAACNPLRCLLLGNHFPSKMHDAT